jgi:formylglycine-generating enzyme required for sulfatase activity
MTKKSTEPKPRQTTLENRSGGVGIDADRVNITGDVVGRDKIVKNVVKQTQIIVQRAQSAAEAAAEARSIEAQLLAEGVSTLAQQLQSAAQDTSAAAHSNPYKGLLEYRLNDAEFYFGRERAVRDVLQQLARGRLTVLQSQSGAGKTSLLEAGLMPQLMAEGHLALRIRPFSVNPSIAIKRTFIPDLSQAPILAAAPLRDFLRRVCDLLEPPTRLVLLLDQFEEFFSQLIDRERADFVRDLADCLDDASLNVSWLLALRSESFGKLASFKPAIHDPFANEYLLEQLTRDEAREVISQPAAQRGVTFEDGLIDTLLDHLGKTEIAPPQMQLVCSTLFEELPPGELVITRALYERTGQVAGILSKYLERVLSRNLLPQQQAPARRLLESLISSETQRVIKTHSELVAELEKRNVTPQTLDVILQQLIDSRLLRTEQNTSSGELQYELAHDYLLQEIKLDPDEQKRKAAQELLEQEARAYRGYHTLLSEDRLKIIDQYRAALHFTPEAEALYQASQVAVQADRIARRRRLWALRVSIGAVAIILLILGPVQWLRREGLRQQARSANPLIELSGGAITVGTADLNREPQEQKLQIAVQVRSFSINRTEVTNRQYQWCLQAGGCLHEPADQTFFANPNLADQPVVFVTAYQANEYCAWLGLRLPTEAEWERAARGLNGAAWQWRDGSDSPPSVTKANLPSSDLPTVNLKPVGSFPEGATPEGVVDLIGNAWEWTSTQLSVSCEIDQCVRSAWNGVEAVVLAVRGGAWNFQLERITQVLPGQADAFEASVGFRCAK